MEPEAHGGAMWPVLRGAGESSGLLEVIVQSNVLMFKLSVSSGMEGDYWFCFFFLVYQSESRLLDSNSNQTAFRSSRR